MISGAGHDAMNMAKSWPSGMIFIPYKGISHHSDEGTEIIYLINGIEVLIQYFKLVDLELE